MNYTTQKALKLFSVNDHVLHADDLKLAEKNQIIPKRKTKSWTAQQIPHIGEKFGFLSKPPYPMVFTIFVTKGGVLKTSLVLNLARMAALHNINTCVLGLDMQGDITNALGFSGQPNHEVSFETAIQQLNQIKGLPDYQRGEVGFKDIIQSTDLSTLSYIPETPELVALEKSITNLNRREHWLKEKVIQPLKNKFDLILIDCSPNWNQLITNALVASDVLVTPLECKINNYRNFKMFETFITEFKEDLNLDFKQIYVPTRYNQNRRLSQDIKSWYQSHLTNCTQTTIRDGVCGEEATAVHQSVAEYSPSHAMSAEMNSLIYELWQLTLPNVQLKHRHLQSQIEI